MLFSALQLIVILNRGNLANCLHLSEIANLIQKSLFTRLFNYLSLISFNRLELLRGNMLDEIAAKHGSMMRYSNREVLNVAKREASVHSEGPNKDVNSE